MMSTMEEETSIDVRNGLEEGELSDSDIVEYIPLARPAHFVPHLNPSSIMKMNIQDEFSGGDSSQSSADVDSDDSDDSSGRLRAKKPKVKLRRHRKSEGAEPVKNKYNIWCKTVQEDSLAENLLSIDVAKNKRYGVESYDHTILFRLNGVAVPDELRVDDDDEGPRSANKRRYRDRYDARLRLGRRTSPESDGREDRGQTRTMPELVVGVDASEEEVAKDIAEKLSEEKHNLILRIVENAGKQKAIELFKETKRIEEDGGMMVMNGFRRRTPGGVFIFLLKRDTDVTADMLREIFSEERQESNKAKRRSQAKHRSQKVEQLKQSLTDSVLPALSSRAEAWAAAAAAAPAPSATSPHVSNPPPSPVTDGRDCSSDVDTNLPPSCAPQLGLLPSDPRAALSNSYDDDYLDIGCGDDMDLF